MPIIGLAEEAGQYSKCPQSLSKTCEVIESHYLNLIINSA